mgnify:CR=1 FL=1
MAFSDDDYRALVMQVLAESSFDDSPINGRQLLEQVVVDVLARARRSDRVDQDTGFESGAARSSSDDSPVNPRQLVQQVVEEHVARIRRPERAGQGPQA